MLAFILLFLKNLNIFLKKMLYLKSSLCKFLYRLLNYEKRFETCNPDLCGLFNQ